jgi:hypothetical protein
MRIGAFSALYLEKIICVPYYSTLKNDWLGDKRFEIDD